MNNIDAVILAGGIGETMYPLTSQEMRHFLPVQGKPLLSYSLELVLDNFFKNVVIVVNNNNESKIRHYIHSKFKHKRASSVKFSFFVADYFLSLAEVISEMITQYVIQKDFLLLYADAITSAPLTDFVDTHYSRLNHITCGFLDKNVSIAVSKKVKLGKSINVGEQPLLVMYSDEDKQASLRQANHDRYCHMRASGAPPKPAKIKDKGTYTLDDLNPRETMSGQKLSLVKIIGKDGLKAKGLSFKLNLAQEMQRVSMRSDLALGNMFIVSKQIFPILVHLAPKFGSFSEELLPFIIDYQKSPKLLRYLGKPGALLLMQEKMATSNQKLDDQAKSSGDLVGSLEGTALLNSQKELFRNKRNVVSGDNLGLQLEGTRMDALQSPLPNLFTSSKIEDGDLGQFPKYHSIWTGQSDLQRRENSQVQSRDARLRIGGHVFKCYYKRVNNIDQYRDICMEALSVSSLFPLYFASRNSSAPFIFNGEQKKCLGLGASYISSLTQFSEIETCKIKNCLIANRVKVGKNCQIENSIVLEGASIGDGAVVSNSCVGAQSILQPNCRLTNIVLGEKNLVRRDQVCEHNTLNMRQDDSSLLGGLEFVDTRSSRKYSQRI